MISTVIPLEQPASRLAVLALGAQDAARERAVELAQALRLPLVDSTTYQAYDMLLVYTPQRLELHDNSARIGSGRTSERPGSRHARTDTPHDREPRINPLYVDFATFNARGNHSSLSRRQPLACAFGKTVRTIVDATAGFGRDAYLLARLGYQVTAMERCAPVYALLHDGIQRLAHDSELASVVADRLSVIHGDARQVLPALRPKPDAVYLDPMFPPKRKKSAAVRKELRLLRRLAGEDTDILQLFDICRRNAGRRVVVKRPDDAPPLAPNLLVSYSGKLVRYDVYAAIPA